MTTKTEPETISRDEFYKLHGLMALALEHYAALKVIERAAAAIVGEPEDGTGYFGRVSDEVWNGETDVGSLLRGLNIVVEDDA